MFMYRLLCVSSSSGCLYSCCGMCRRVVLIKWRTYHNSKTNSNSKLAHVCVAKRACLDIYVYYQTTLDDFRIYSVAAAGQTLHTQFAHTRHEPRSVSHTHSHPRNTISTRCSGFSALARVSNAIFPRGKFPNLLRTLDFLVTTRRSSRANWTPAHVLVVVFVFLFGFHALRTLSSLVRLG